MAFTDDESGEIAHDSGATGPQQGYQRRQLNEGWQFRQAGKDRAYPAQVPGSNFTDLLRNGLIPDPLIGDNEKSIGWVEQADWEYSLDFMAGPQELGYDRAFLIFEGLDTHCDVRLNGESILQADNMFRRYEIDVSAHLALGRNLLELRFRSPLAYGAEALARCGHCYPAENDKSEGHVGVFSRKAPYHFGWDWGPKLIPSGIWKPVWLEFRNAGRLIDVAHSIEQLEADSAALQLSAEIEAWHDGEVRVEAAIDGQIVEQAANLTPSPSPSSSPSGRYWRCDAPVNIANPRLWAPAGLGDAHLYKLTLRLLIDGVEADCRTLRIGLRDITVVREADSAGTAFYVKVNGEPVFMKGANLIPPDSFIERLDEARMRRIFEDALAANMNMLRVWGGGVYLPDRFYDLADEYGLLIWQDFMFACTLYPSDPAFLASAKREASEQVRRLRHHASIALWCGNNEISMGIADWGWKERFGYADDVFASMVAGNTALFDALIPEVLEENDPSRFYLPSSPTAFWDSEPGSEAHGNSHFWGVWHGGMPFSAYAERVPRFMSEFGFQSFPLIGAVERFTEEEDRYLGSPVMLSHQKHSRGTNIIRTHMREEYGEPEDLASFCYLSQVQQADGLRLAFEAHRRAMPFCMGSVYWQLNDCWPAMSWSSVDYYGTWKALHYQAQRSFAPVALSIAAAGDGSASGGLAVNIVSDLADALAANLRVSLLGFDGAILFEERLPVTIGSRSSAPYYLIDEARFPPGFDPAASLIRAELEDYPAAPAIIHLFRAHRDLHLADPHIELALSPYEGGTRLDLGCAHFARAVCLSFAKTQDTLPGLAPNFSDNFIDLVPGKPRSVTIPIEGLTRADIAVTSVYNAQQTQKCRG